LVLSAQAQTAESAPPQADSAPGIEQPVVAEPAAPTQPGAPTLAPAPPPCPVCPVGYVCQNGGCVPMAYPMCAPGYFFDGYYCVPGAYLQGAPPPGYRDPEEERAFALRLENRMRGRLTIDLQGGMGMLGTSEWESRTSVIALNVATLFGYRRNFQPRFGMLFRGGAFLGAAIFSYNDSSSSSSSSSDSDATTMIGVLGEGGPFFGPFGRFYFGPTLWAGYITFDKKDLQAGPTGYGFHLSDGEMYGIGATGGVVVGAREQIDITFSLRADLNPDHKVTLFGMGGVGFHI
jgi:hypothetical protein